jgi:hypothetical protein
MATRNPITNDLIKSKHSDTYADRFDAIFRKPKKMTEQELYESELDRADAKYQQEKDDATM